MTARFTELSLYIGIAVHIFYVFFMFPIHTESIKLPTSMLRCLFTAFVLRCTCATCVHIKWRSDRRNVFHYIQQCVRLNNAHVLAVTHRLQCRRLKHSRFMRCSLFWRVVVVVTREEE